MKVYTRKGDGGKTSLLGGTRVDKDDLRIEAYGTVDELNSWMGMLADAEVLSDYRTFIQQLQSHLFTIGSHLANDPENSRFELPKIPETIIEEMEASIDDMNTKLPDLKSFVLPGGHPVNAQSHVARCVCRRAERRCVALSRSATVEPLIIQFLNRLSDWLFVLGRHVAVHHGEGEIPWKP
ncbi:cob(I)yrinic acid a,c-diamide adenosyltransferase [Pontibacter sp. G13]|uniref:cob(I)yrinic acid a,c-diamide adenosyltransferase n=1 Tax=Pontibacter sp. G13 TaxID=3074898 RepID=UPI00288BAF93|nr:cob(I)yrinic acid a,c-diamide adenosyltransferase [Pontibacter sp. G13]WNJ19518.1 cob(I)yrinic acid a,c-diamide adenosyltransferase [Pontibacter sp. G13]